MKLSPRAIRACRALLNNPIMREQLDDIAGCSNGPELIAELRRKGLNIPCQRVERIDKDGCACYPGLYSFTEEDKQKAREWLKETT